MTTGRSGRFRTDPGSCDSRNHAERATVAIAADPANDHSSDSHGSSRNRSPINDGINRTASRAATSAHLRARDGAPGGGGDAVGGALDRVRADAIEHGRARAAAARAIAPAREKR